MNIIRFVQQFIPVTMVAILCLYSCSKNDIYQEVDYRNADYLIKSNSGLAFYNQLVQQSGLGPVLSGLGPYTVFVPNDQSFRSAGYTQVSLASAENSSWGSELINYLITDGNFRLEKLPFAFNTAVRSRNGHHIYLSRWIPQSGDTVYSVNGVPVVKTSLESDNALVHILSGIPEINRYNNLTDRIAGSGELTLFSRALSVSKVDRLLREPGGRTVFAPNNAAMVAFGYRTLEDIDSADPAEIEKLVRRHILGDVYFRNDFRLLTAFERKTGLELDYYNPETRQVITYMGEGSSGDFTAQMQSGTEVRISYAFGSTFIGTATGLEMASMDRLSLTVGNEKAVALLDQKDMASDNGVVHVINKVLPTN